MSFSMFFYPAMLALLVLAVVWLVLGLRRRSRWRLCASLGLFLLMGTCMGLFMEFLARM